MRNQPAIRPIFLFFLFFTLKLSAQSVSGVINSYYHVSAVNTVSNTVTLNSVAGLSAGTKVLIIQMKGAAINSANASTYGDLSAIQDAGNYEFNYICSISGNDVLLEYQLIRAYDPTGLVQLVSVPIYSAVTIGGTVSSTAWDPVAGTGGVIAMEATSSITINNNIDVSGQGFIGGALVNYPVPPYDCVFAVNVTDYYTSIPPSDKYHTGGKKGEGITDYILNEEYGRGKLANGGGGGNNNNTGGAGGGNYGAGGNGGNRTMESFFSCHGTNPGVGGLSLSPYGYSVPQNRIFLGGGGGSGHENNGVSTPGGNGGGIVILTAPLITSGGSSILANGVVSTNPTNTNPLEAEGDGGGGGGAGGTVIINAALVSGTLNIQTNGANGSNSSNLVSDCTGPGGGGGGGTIWVSGASFPAAISGSVSGGSSGVVSAGSGIAACRGSANGATAGSNGNQQTGFVAPMGASAVCTVLAASDLIYFRGALTSEGALISWGLYNTDNISSYSLEISFDRINYSQIALIMNNQEKAISWLDKREISGTVYYRLKIFYKNNTTQYSATLPISNLNSAAFQVLSLQPNPADDQIVLSIYSSTMKNSTFVIYNSVGQAIRSMNVIVNKGYSNLQIPVNGLAAGTFVIKVENDQTRFTRPFIKRK